MENIILEKALEIVYKEFYDEDKIRVFGMKGDTIDILLSLGGDEFLKRFKKHRYRRYLSDKEYSSLSTASKFIHDIDRESHRNIYGRLGFDAEEHKYYVWLNEREED
jgi:hypothetical protein